MKIRNAKATSHFASQMWIVSVFLVLYDSSLNLFGFWIFFRQIQDSWIHICGLWNLINQQNKQQINENKTIKVFFVKTLVERFGTSQVKIPIRCFQSPRIYIHTRFVQKTELFNLQWNKVNICFINDKGWPIRD